MATKEVKDALTEVKDALIATMVTVGQAAYEAVENLKKSLDKYNEITRDNKNINDFCKGIDIKTRLETQGPAQAKEKEVDKDSAPPTPKFNK